MTTATVRIQEQLERAFSLGWQARTNGRRLSDNPFGFSSLQRNYWASGWSQSEREITAAVLAGRSR